MQVNRGRRVQLWMDPLSFVTREQWKTQGVTRGRLDVSSTISLIFTEKKNVYRNGKQPLISNLPENKVKPSMFPGTPGNYLRTGEAEGYFSVL